MKIVTHYFIILQIILLNGFFNLFGQCPDKIDCGSCPAATNEKINNAIVTGELTSPIYDDEFAPMNKAELLTHRKTSEYLEKPIYNILYWTIAIFFFTCLAGILVRFSKLRFLRYFILIASIAILGFYRGGCPCMISSFEDSILITAGYNIHWVYLLWFLGLIPITYIFGQVWCGWVCHLGGIQEFLFIKSRFTFLTGKKARLTLKTIRWLLFFTLIFQLILTSTNEYCKIDPFLVAFNIKATNLTGLVLLIFLLVSSLLIYRPFCRGACPVGLILGYVTKIPGAMRLSRNDDCTNCGICSSSCKMQAIDKDAISFDNKDIKKEIRINSSDCIQCGDCLDSCNNDGIIFKRKKIR